ncbi:uncharacterized membrane protein (DUF106 family) [Virgibacillus litoralis]|uniref:Uncharacterized membrane protein (DUF106 family) n=1 Tax=Virgibacillus litoralis TaxID=578221 RepID=A0ABS4HDV8_9BACI|nr:uncharacterized membrane protein (DUF106 family) [Virgibacillus litoralis]
MVGILLAALYAPLFTSSINNGADFGLAAILFGLLHFWETPAWLIIIIGVIVGTGISYIF